MATGHWPSIGGKMKKYFLILIFAIFTVSLFAKDESTMYWENEIDNNGQLFTYYLFKTDEQLSNNLENLIKINTGIKSDYLMPNISTLTKQMVSEEYLQKNCPKLYKMWFKQEGDENNQIDWEGYKHCFVALPAGNDMGFLMLCKRKEEKAYLSLAMYIYGGLNWTYTNQTLDLFETYVD